MPCNSAIPTITHPEALASREGGVHEVEDLCLIHVLENVILTWSQLHTNLQAHIEQERNKSFGLMRMENTEKCPRSSRAFKICRYPPIPTGPGVVVRANENHVIHAAGSHVFCATLTSLVLPCLDTIVTT